MIANSSDVLRCLHFLCFPHFLHFPHSFPRFLYFLEGDGHRSESYRKRQCFLARLETRLYVPMSAGSAHLNLTTPKAKYLTTPFREPQNGSFLNTSKGQFFCSLGGSNWAAMLLDRDWLALF